jgi:hypothetical protein
MSMLYLKCGAVAGSLRAFRAGLVDGLATEREARGSLSELAASEPKGRSR